MAATIGSIEVTLKLLGAEKYALDLKNSANATEASANRISRSTTGAAKGAEQLSTSLSALSRGNSGLNSLALSALRAETSIGTLNKGLSALAATVGGISGALAVKAVQDYADAYTSVQNRIAAVVSASRERISVENDLFNLAQRTRSSFDSTVQLYQRLTLAASNLGASQHDILRVVETTQKAFVTGGSSVAEAASTATQLAQALGSGRLQGDEFRSISENAPILFQAIAKQFGVTTGQLKQLSTEGKLDAKAVFDAILSASRDVDDAFSRTSPTIAAGIQQIDNALTRYIGTTDQSIGASRTLANGLAFVADNIKQIGDSAQYAVAVLGSVLFSRGLVGRGGGELGGLAGFITAPFRRATAEAKTAIDQTKASLVLAQQVRDTAAAKVVDAFEATRAVKSSIAARPEQFADKVALRDREILKNEVSTAKKNIDGAYQRYVDLQKQINAVAPVVGVAGAKAAAAEAKAASAASDAIAKQIAAEDRLAQTVSKSAETVAFARSTAASGLVDVRRRGDEAVAAARKDLNDAQQYQRNVQGKAATLPTGGTILKEAAQQVQSRTSVLQSAIRKQANDVAAETRRGETLVESAENEALRKNTSAQRQVDATRASADRRIAALRQASARVAETTDAGDAAATSKRVSLVEQQARAQADSVANTKRLRDALSLQSANEQIITRSSQQGAAPVLNTALRDQAKALEDLAAKNRVVAAAEEVANGAVRRASVLRVGLNAVLSASSAALGGLISILGGPVGAALTAVSVGLIGYSLYQEHAAQAAKEHADALEGLTERVRQVNEEIAKGRQRSITDIIGDRASLDGAGKAVDDLRSNLISALQPFQDKTLFADDLNPALVAPGKLSSAASSIGLDMERINESLRSARPGSLEFQSALSDLIRVLEQLGKTDIDLTKQVNELLRAANAARAAADQVSAARNAFGAAINPSNFDARDAANPEAIGTQILKNLPLPDEPVLRDPELGKLIGERIKAKAGQSKRQDFIDAQATKILDEINSGGGRISISDAQRLAGQRFDLENPATAKKSSAEKNAETLAKKLKDLDQEASVSGLSELDQKTVRFAQSAKVATDNIDAFVKAAQSGNLSNLPPDIEKIRNGIEKLEATKFARGQLDELIPARKLDQQLAQLRLAAQTMPEVAAQFDELEKRIRVDNASEFAKGAASAITDFARSSVTDFKNIGQAAEALSKKILELALNAALFKPLERELTSLFSSAFGGGSGGNLFSGLGSLLGLGGGGSATNGLYPTLSAAAVKFHRGGIAGAGGEAITAPASLFVNAPKFHAGLKPNELAAIIEDGEAVLTRPQQTAVAAAAAGARTAIVPSVQLGVTINNAPSTPEVSQDGNGNVSIDFALNSLEARTAQRAGRGQGPLAGLFQRSVPRNG